MQANQRLADRNAFRLFMKELGRRSASLAIFNSELADALVLDVRRWVDSVKQEPDRLEVGSGETSSRLFSEQTRRYAEFIEPILFGESQEITHVRVAKLLSMAQGVSSGPARELARCLEICRLLEVNLSEMDEDQLRVAFVAATYFLLEEDMILDELDGGLDDDVEVLEMALSAIDESFQMQRKE
jgi:hypothetical protein